MDFADERWIKGLPESLLVSDKAEFSEIGDLNAFRAAIKSVFTARLAVRFCQCGPNLFSVINLYTLWRYSLNAGAEWSFPTEEKCGFLEKFLF
jgi:hypothetical protein